MINGLMDNGSEIYSPDMKCPYCDDNTQDLKIGRNVCKFCEGKFRINFDDEQQIYILEKDLR